MKTRLLTIFAAAIMLAGCGNQEKTTATESSTTEDIMELSYDESYEKVDGDKNGNYTAFLNNEKEAELDCSEEYLFRNENKKKFNFEDLKRIVSEDDFWHDGTVACRYYYIDCGLDGDYELVMRLGKYNSLIDELFVIKDVDGELLIRYINGNVEKGDVGITEKGYVGEFGKAGAAVAEYRNGFLDKDARYIHYYDFTYYLELESGMCGIKDDEVLEDYQLLVYSFGEGEEKVTMSEVYEPVTVDDELDRKVKNGLLEEGYKFYSRKEINERLFKRADEIGLDRSIIVGQPADDDEN